MNNRYSAFISYRHRSPDKEIAVALHRMIENYPIPKHLRNVASDKHPGKVFRDQDELPLSANLGQDLETALDNSDWLICICSPAYPQSLWCMREIDYFLEHHDRDHILTILTEGEPSDSFPEQLRYTFNASGERIETEPLAADVRADHLKKSLKKLKREKLRLLAPMLGTTYDGLYQRQKRRTVRNAFIMSSAAALLLAGFLAYALIQNARIDEQRITASRNETDLLIEKSAYYASLHRKIEARHLAMQAHQVSETIDGYDEEQIRETLAITCYSGDFSIEAAMDLDHFSPTASTEIFSPNGTRAIGPVSASTVACCDTVTGQRLWTRRYENEISSIRWKADSTMVAVTVSWSHSIELLDADTGSVIAGISLLWARNASFAGDLVCISFEQGFVLWDPVADPEGSSLQWILQEPAGQFLHSQVFENSRYVTAMNYTGPTLTTGIIDTVSEQAALITLPGQQVVSGYTVSPDGMKIFAHQYDHVYVYDLDTETILWQEESPYAILPSGEQNPQDPIWSGDRIYDNMTDAEGVRCRVYNAVTGETLFDIENDLVMRVSTDGSRLIGRYGLYSSADGSLLVRYPGTLLAVDPLEQHYLMAENAFYLETAIGQGTQYTLTAAPALYAEKNENNGAATKDGHYTVMIIPSENALHFVNTAKDNAYHSIYDFNFGAQASAAKIVFSAGQQLAAIAGERGNISVFDLENGKELCQWDNFYLQSSIRAMTFSADDRFLMAEDWQQKTYAVYSVTGGNLLYTMHATAEVTDWGFDSVTGDAVICYADGSALAADLFTTADELYSYAGSMMK